MIDHILRGQYASYKIIEEIGNGGHGETFKANVVDVVDGFSKKEFISQVVIVKIPKIQLGQAIHLRFERLALIFKTFMIEYASMQRLAGLKCAAQGIDFGTYQYVLDKEKNISPPVVFIVQEFVEGLRLDEFVKKEFSSDDNFAGIQNHIEYFELIKKLADGLLQIHQAQIVHGDIWPNNIMINNEKNPVFIDFGQALFRELSGGPFGRPGDSHPYVAPEGSGTVGADIYSLGGVMFYLATGNTPLPLYKNIKDIDVLKDKITEQIKEKNNKLYTTNSGVVDVITRCLRHSQHDRIPHALTLIQDVEIFSTTDPLAGNLKGLCEEVEKLNSGNNQLFSWMANFKINLLLRVIQDMAHGIYDLIGNHQDIVSGLTQYLASLKQGDQYLTVSLPSFWHSANIGVNGRFLTMNRLIAQRGATVRRVLILTTEDEQEDEVKRIIKSHCRVMEELDATGINSTKPELSEGGYFTGVKIVTQNEREELYKGRKHFGLVIKDGQKILIFPIYREDGGMAAIQFRSTSDLTDGLQNYFNELLSDSTSIQSYCSTIG